MFTYKNESTKPVEQITFEGFSELICNIMFSWAVYNVHIYFTNPVLHKEIPDIDVSWIDCAGGPSIIIHQYGASIILM